MATTRWLRGWHVNLQEDHIAFEVEARTDDGVTLRVITKKYTTVLQAAGKNALSTADIIALAAQAGLVVDNIANAP